MISRYEDPFIRKLFSDSVKYDRWRQVELHYLDALVTKKVAPARALENATSTPTPTPSAVHEREAKVGHDVVAFLVEWMSMMPDPDLARWVHHGLTSSDIVDPAHHTALHEVGEHLLDQAVTLHRILLEASNEHTDTFRLGRTHGQAAEPTTWGHRMLEFAQMLGRAQRSFADAKNQVWINKLPGAVGTGALTPLVTGRQYVAGGQVYPRDLQAQWAMGAIGLVLVCEALAMEIRLSSRFEMGEVAERSTRIGSSAMPHKNNPITSEKVTGLARVARGLLSPILETVTLHHERDISNSSVERTAVVDLAHITSHCLSSMIEVMSNLHVDTVRMADNLLAAGPLAYSSLYLATLTELGVDYVTAHSWVNQAMREEDPENYILVKMFSAGFGPEGDEFSKWISMRANPQWMTRHIR